MIRIRYLRPWRRRKAGDSEDCNDGVANVLIRRKIATVDRPPPPAPKPERKGARR